jgi:NADPH:quinone reductase
MRAIRIHEAGGPEKLRLEDVPVPSPGPGEVRIRIEAAGINFVDVYRRSGLYPLSLPATLGQEAAGVVSAVGPGVAGFGIGDRVATANAAGAYAEQTLAPAALTAPLPPEISSPGAAALLLQGTTAHFLAADTYQLEPGDTALIHAAAGGVGLLLVQIAKLRNARVLACVGSEAKAPLAREAGADEVIVSPPADVAAAARRFTQGEGVDVVYDSVGRDTFAGSLDSLKPRGLFVSYGNASGPVPPFAPLLLTQKGSLFFTRPSLAHHLRTAEELRARTGELFRWVAEGRLRIRIGATYPLEEAAEAHRALEGRRTTGKVLLVP